MMSGTSLRMSLSSEWLGHTIDTLSTNVRALRGDSEWEQKSEQSAQQ